LSAVDLAVAQHEAAHVVVGVALGMRLRSATARATPNPRDPAEGFALFRGGSATALGLMYAAGVAWDDALGEDSPADRKLIRELGFTLRDSRGLVRASRSMLRDLSPAHARVTRALLERNLGAADVARLARGEPLRTEDEWSKSCSWNHAA
jgi:hypothetical protein